MIKGAIGKRNNKNKKQNRIIHTIFLTHRFLYGKLLDRWLDNKQKEHKKNEEGCIIQKWKFSKGKKKQLEKDIFKHEYDVLQGHVFEWKDKGVDESNKYIVGNVCRKVLESFCHFQFNNAEYTPDPNDLNKDCLHAMSHFPSSDNEDCSVEMVQQMPDTLLSFIKNKNPTHFEKKLANYEKKVKGNE